MDLSVMNFDEPVSAEPSRMAFVTGGKKYLVREGAGDAIVRWRNAVIKASKLAHEGKTLLAGEGLADTEILLVSLCCRSLDTDGNVVTKDGKELTVPIEVVRGWPYPVVQAVFDKAKMFSRLQEFESTQTLEARINELTKILEKRRNDEDAEKNSSSSGDRGSE